MDRKFVSDFAYSVHGQNGIFVNQSGTGILSFVRETSVL